MKTNLFTIDAWRGRFHNLAIISISTFVLFILWAIFIYNFQKPTPVAAVCRDTITNCWCASGQQVCSHQLSDCSNAVEVHNEMPGADACSVTLNTTVNSSIASPVSSATPTASPTPTPTLSPSVSPSPSGSSTTIIIGVGGGPATSASPDVVAMQGDNQAGELPKTGLPLAGLALGGLAPLGLKLKNFHSRYFGHSDPNLIWSEKQLKK